MSSSRLQEMHERVQKLIPDGPSNCPGSTPDLANKEVIIRAIRAEIIKNYITNDDFIEELGLKSDTDTLTMKKV